MAQDLLSALGARLEAQLNAKDARIKTIEDAVKAQVSANPPAPFTLLADGTKQFGYAPSVDTAVPTDSSSQQTDSADFGIGATFRRKGVLSDIPMPVTRLGDGVVFTAFTDSEGSHEMSFAKNQIEMVTKAPATAEAENTSHLVAPFAALLSATAQIFSGAAVETKTASAEPELVSTSAIAEATAVPTGEMLPLTPATQNPILLTGNAASNDVPVAATVTAPVVVTESAVATTTAAAVVAAATAATTTTATTTSTAATTAATTTTATAAAAAKSASNSSASFVMLSDGTKQFGYAPTGGPSGYVPPAKTPPVPTEYGVGATIRRKGSLSDTPITVTRVGDGVVFANFTDSEGTREMAFYPNQMDLMTAAP